MQTKTAQRKAALAENQLTTFKHRLPVPHRYKGPDCSCGHSLYQHQNKLGHGIMWGWKWCHDDRCLCRAYHADADQVRYYSRLEFVVYYVTRTIMILARNRWRPQR